MLFLKMQRDTLLAPLQAVSGMVEKRHQQSILSNVLLEKRGATVTLLATDGEMQITATSDGVSGDGDGAITVGARKLLEILRSLPEASEVSLTLDDRRLLLRAGKSRFNLQTLPAEDFPCMALSEGEGHRLPLAQKHFRHLLAQTQYAMGVQDVRYYLNGLLLIIERHELRAVATDGHRMAVASIDAADAPDEAQEPSAGVHASRHELILPRKAVIELHRLLADSDDPLVVDMLPSQARFQFGSITLVSKLIEGRFPDYQRVIPATLRSEIVVNRSLLLQSMARAAILTTDKFRGVRVLLDNDSLKITVANVEQEEALEEIEVDYQGEVLDVGFNVSYLLDVLNNTNDETITWAFNDAQSSALLTVPGNDRFRYVLMPMRI